MEVNEVYVVLILLRYLKRKSGNLKVIVEDVWFIHLSKYGDFICLLHVILYCLPQASGAFMRVIYYCYVAVLEKKR